jgi:hypothetical protein
MFIRMAAKVRVSYLTLWAVGQDNGGRKGSEKPMEAEACIISLSNFSLVISGIPQAKAHQTLGDPQVKLSSYLSSYLALYREELEECLRFLHPAIFVCLGCLGSFSGGI